MGRYGPCRGFRNPIDRRHSDFVIDIAVQFDFNCLSVTWNDILFLSKNKCRRSSELVNFYVSFPISLVIVIVPSLVAVSSLGDIENKRRDVVIARDPT